MLLKGSGVCRLVGESFLISSYHGNVRISLQERAQQNARGTWRSSKPYLIGGKEWNKFMKVVEFEPDLEKWIEF